MASIEALKIEEIQVQTATTTEEKKLLPGNLAVLFQYVTEAYTATKKQLNAVAAHSLAASSGASKVGSSNGNDPLPAPLMPDSGSPDPSVVNTDSGFDLQGNIDKLRDFITAMRNGQPGAFQNFMSFIANLTSNGDMTPDMTKALDDMDASSAIMVAMNQGMMFAFFNGYPTSTNNGIQGATAWITDTLNALNKLPKSNKYIDQMKGALQGLQTAVGTVAHPGVFSEQHMDANGNLIWVSDLSGLTYNWTNPSLGNDQSMIDFLIGNSGVLGNPPYPNSYVDELNNDLGAIMKDLRMNELKKLLGSYPDPIIAIWLFLMLVEDQEQNNQEKVLASTTDALTDDTNKYATPLLQLMQSFGNGLPTDPKALANAEEFKNLFYESQDAISGANKTESIADSYTSNVFNFVLGTQVSFVASNGKLVQASMAQVLNLQSVDGYQLTAGDRVRALNSLNASPDPKNPTPGAAPTQGQGIINALTQGGALITGTSKTVSTQLSTVAQVDDQVVKLGQSGVSPTGGGLVELEQKTVDNQISH